MQQQIATAVVVDWPTILALLGALFTLVCGSYVYTNRSVGKLYDWVEKQLEHLKTNELQHLQDRLDLSDKRQDHSESRLDDLER